MLHVISNSIYKTKAFKNVVVTGVVLGTDGKKMSKNLGNYPDPKLMLQKYGGDALRLYLLGSPVMKGEDIIISEEEYKNQIKGEFIDIKYEVPSDDYFKNPKKKDGEYKLPYSRFIENKELKRFSNGFVVFTPFPFEKKKKEIDQLK